MISTESELLQRIADDLVWRRRELTDLRFLVQNNRSKTKAITLLVLGLTALVCGEYLAGFLTLAQGLLLREAASQKPPDRRQLCLIVQHVSCQATHWSANALRLAEVLGVGLATRPRDEPASSLHREIYALDGAYAETKAAMARSGM